VNSKLYFSALFASALILATTTANAEDDLVNAVKSGTFDLNLRYRFEHVDDDIRQPNGNRLRDADASTLRTTLGFKSGEFHSFSARLLFANVTEVGADDYNDGSNGKTQYAAVIDPSGSDIEEAYIQYAGFENTKIKAGRQYITYRKAPFHRFMGTVLWRQNWQTHDAVTIENTSLPDTKLRYAYSWNINRIFGDDAPGALSDFDSNSHMFNAQYSGISYGTLEAYAYLLDLDNARAFSTQTFGVRFSGKAPINETVKALYAVEYAHQSDYDDNPNNISADYFLGEAGAAFKFDSPIKTLALKFDYELLGGDGGADRFVTIVATGHAFQGWADRFLVTPGDGIEDFYFTGVATFWKAKLVTVYHNLNSDDGSYDYGEEIDVLLTATFKKHYTFGLKFSSYNADRNAQNLARNGANAGVTRDVEKYWAFAQVKF